VLCTLRKTTVNLVPCGSIFDARFRAATRQDAPAEPVRMKQLEETSDDQRKWNRQAPVVNKRVPRQSSSWQCLQAYGVWIANFKRQGVDSVCVPLQISERVASIWCLRR
jgi:hypothetical protein